VPVQVVAPESRAKADLPGIVGEDGVGVLVGTLRDIVRWWP
jgi:hypothetical protein